MIFSYCVNLKREKQASSMATGNLKKIASIDAQYILIALAKVSEEDRLLKAIMEMEITQFLLAAQSAKLA